MIPDMECVIFYSVRRARWYAKAATTRTCSCITGNDAPVEKAVLSFSPPHEQHGIQQRSSKQASIQVKIRPGGCVQPPGE
jgi:hypothetical protein